MSVRTYCVIPHTAREDTDFFQGVFEDGIRVRYQGRLHSLLFSHVLSPAHDYVKHVNGPLLAMLRDGGNATLLIATPYAENTPGDTTARSASSSAAPSPSHSLNVSEATVVAMELYSQLFPLLFRAVETCAVAHVSAVTVSAEERVLLDCLRGDARLRSLAEASRVTVRRQHSATEWGTVLHILERRHAALERADAAASSLASQTACVVVVELEGHGRLAVVDVASSQALLQQLTLILGMEREGEERTFPSHTPLREVLRRNVPPLAAVQVVCLPAPQDAVRQTMRVLHFGSTIEAMRSELPLLGGTSDSEERERGGGGAVPSRARRDTAAAAARAKVFTRPSAPTASRPLASASSSPSFVAAAPRSSVGPHDRSTSNSRRNSPAHSIAQEKSRGEQEQEEEEEEEEDDGATRVMPQSSDRAPALRRSGSYDTRNTAREPSGAVRTTERRSGSSHNDSTPARLPLPKSRTTEEAVRQQAREDQLRHRVAALEATVAAMDAEVQQAQAARDEAVRGRARAELELRSKANALADLQRAHSKAAQEKADYTQLVEKLMRQVRLLEKDTSRQKRQDMTVVKELRQVKAERAALEQQLSSLRKEVMLFRRDATYRAREGTLSRIVRSDVSIPAPGSAPAGAAAAQRGSGLSSSLVHSQRLAPRARRLYDSSLEEEEERAAKGNTDNKGGAATDTEAVSPATAASPLASSGRVRDITVEELRWRNRHLEEEVNRLQERLLGFLTQPNRSAKLQSPPGDNSNETNEVEVEPQEACKACDATLERLERVTHKLERTRHERDRLRSLLRSSAVLRSRSEDSDEESGSEASTVAAPGDGGAGGKRSRSAQERSARRVLSDVDAVQGVAASLLAGCASLHAQLECAQALLDRRLRQHRSSDGAAAAAAAPTATDPLSHLSARVIAEHHEAVAALAESLRHIASKPAVSPPLPAPSHSGASALNASLASQALPPVPRTATAANVETLTHYLSFEAERCRHLRAFVPTFAQLAVATEHLLMRLEATEPER